ncbi:hypothetical protein [Streptomyces lunalinharesii]|uniref:hypothetical protein n=1 Tax=Streptomyces lunalinharesii TaxID=333384 RepID=UPI0031D0F831
MTVVTGLVALLVQGGWDWLREEMSDPPELVAYAPAVEGCTPKYLNARLDELRAHPQTVDHGGVLIPTADAWPSVNVTVQAKTSQAIVLTGAKVSVLSARPLPARGSVVDAECGGGMDERAFDVDLGTDPVSVRPTVARTGQGGVVKSRNFPFKVSSGDPEQFVFNVKHVAQDVRFAITFSWVSDGEPGSTRLDNGGQGYHVMGLPTNLPRYSRVDVFKGKRPARNSTPDAP